MECMLNNLSLEKNFNSEEKLISVIKNYFIPILNFIHGYSKEKNEKAIIYKIKDMWNTELFYEMSLGDFLKKYSNRTEIQNFKSKISIFGRPFWDDDIKTKRENNIVCPNGEEIPNCITEAFYRQICLLSFKGNKYSEERLKLTVNGEHTEIFNASTKKTLFESLPIYYGTKIKQSQNLEINKKNITFEIRDDEEGEVFDPHFHLTEKKGKKRSAQIKINKDFELKAGDNNLRLEWLDWCKKNFFYIKELWNYRHGDKCMIKESK